MPLNEVLKQCELDFDQSLDVLCEMAKIESVSFDGFEPQNVFDCCKHVENLFSEIGFKSEILQIEGAFPCIYAESKLKEGLPTILLYAHYDVQPPMRVEKWDSPPFTPTERNGRLYGRGCADDKAGITVHLASIAAYVKSTTELPVNIKCLIEGEEEIGSPHLEKYIEKLGEKFKADTVIIADVSNYDVGKPAIVNSLRGNLCCEVQLNSLRAPLHSGMWGGPIPDVSQAMAKVLASLSDEKGLIAIDDIYDGIIPLSETEKKSLDSLEYSENDLKEQSGFFSNTNVIDAEVNPLESIWRRPSITVTSMLSGDKKNAGNVIQDEAWARISMRLVPGMDPDTCYKKLCGHLEKHTPWGMQIEIKSLHRDPAWMCSAENDVFKIALEALTEGFNEQAVVIGCGGSIPLVNTIEKFIGKVPILLTGIEDPYTQAHSENESLHLGDFKSAIRSQIILFDSLGNSL